MQCEHEWVGTMPTMRKPGYYIIEDMDRALGLLCFKCGEHKSSPRFDALAHRYVEGVLGALKKR